MVIFFVPFFLQLPRPFEKSPRSAAQFDTVASVCEDDVTAAPCGLVDMAENISVSVRIRPLNKREIDSDQKEAWRVLQGTTIVPSEHNPRPGTTPFAFDHVFDGPCETRDVYDRCAKSIMTSALEGQNGTIFVYGQTSSGKTHTMQGNEESPGIVPLGITFMFDEIKKRAANVDFLVRCSYVEIYNENITDLLNPKNTNMKLHTNAKGGCFVGGVTEPVIAIAAQATELITKGMANRSVGETKMNSESSRSHSLLRFVIESRDKSDASGAVRIAELNLVDLAGSERQSHTQATGTRLKEGANINKSLLTLSNVIAKLSEGAVGQHIPYRDSKLTRMLERALGGNSRTAIICTVTNAAVHGEETLSTLKFATRAKTIKNTAEVNEVLDDQAMLRKYKKEIDQLKKKLRYTSAGGEKDMEICNMINQLQSLQDENAALECEKQELIARQGKLTDLVISAGANMSIEAAAEAHARKLKATTRQVLTFTCLLVAFLVQKYKY
jgi:centromeric protein E